ncbi:hypothetical protein PRIPAC_97643 [Pristionchus pacificus]|uniref:Uncharacterized protein n=1 Tax=Pristionchus pacificus TaxID=54126 RepID=A0A2A6BDL6_PRIPA|nr:hypothetical protein PRIPAC_97643 [Pristionchus pacificus]|eukprot:PDM63995.1 hypothetical protein PRIPAC_49496 [Pristionchus pacificus]
MADYPLVRAQSSLALARSETRPTLLSRTYSVPDLGQYFRWSDKYKPQWHTTRTYTPYRYRRDYDLSLEPRWFDRLIRGRYDDYWYDKYYYFSPLYRASYYPRWRYSYSDYLPNPYYWSPYSSYWTRYKGYWHDKEISPRYELLKRSNQVGYDYDYPSYYRRTYDSSFDRYLRSTYTPYRSYTYDSLSSSLARGLSMYRAGLMTYSTLHNYWLTPTAWDRRFKDWRELYVTQLPSVNQIPSYYDRRAREYFATWSK